MRAAEIEEQAAAWLIREDSGRWTQADKAGRDAWLAESTAHRIVYLRLKSVWDRSERLAALRPVSLPRPQARRRTWLPRQMIAAAFALLVVSGVAGAFWPWQSPNDVYRTPIGARETVHLADGTSVELNTNTKLRTVVTAKKREVILDHGEAYFQVTHDAAKPFVVLAGNRRITDLGTKFSVRRDGDHVQIIVTEGKVSIQDLGHPEAPAAILAKADTQVVASAAGTLVTRPTPQEVQRALSWRSGLLTFNQETLASVAAEFNRYNRKKLVLEGHAVAETRIGGSFEADNVEAFARLLRAGFGFKISETGTEVRVSE